MKPPYAALRIFGGRTNPLRLTLLGAIAAPFVAAFIAYNSRVDTFRTWVEQPLWGIFCAAALGASACFATSLLERPLLALQQRLRLRWWITFLAAALLSVGVLIAVAYLQVLLLSQRQGIPLSSAMADMAGFLGFTVLIASAGDGYFRARDASAAMHNALSRARALEMQINPHFFFNTLNTIAAQIPEAPADAQENVRLLASLFRRTMEQAAHTMTPLAEELEFVRQYLHIEQCRFGERLRFVLPPPEDVGGLEIPRLTLQPLVENAVRHGIGSLLEGGTITVELAHRAPGYVLRVRNPMEGNPPLPAKFFPEGHALDLIRQRLQALYGPTAQVCVETQRGQVTVSVEIPARTWKGPLASCAF